MKNLFTLTALFLSIVLSIALCTSTASWAGGPIKVHVVPPPPPMPLLPPAPPCPPSQPFFTLPPLGLNLYTGLRIYMLDGVTELSMKDYGKLNFGDAFGWSSKSASVEFSLGGRVPRLIEATFTWVPPIERIGNGVPSLPLALGGYTFGPRTADTIRLTTSLSGNKLLLATPAIMGRRLMPTALVEWWRMTITVNGTPNTASTSQVPVDVKQDYQKIMTAAGVSGVLPYQSLGLTYELLYVFGGGARGWVAEGGVGVSNGRLSMTGGYRYDARTLTFGGGDFTMNATGPFLSFGLLL